MDFYALGIDLHKKFAYWTLINEHRDVLWEGKVVTEAKATVRALECLPVSPEQCRAVIEPIESWGWYADLLESQGVEMKLANPLQVSLIAKSRLKHDKVDSKILAELLRAGFLPTSYLAPRHIRDLRELLRSRVCLVRMQTRIKNRIHGILTKHGLKSPVSDLFGTKGLQWLVAQTFPSDWARERDSLLRVFAAIRQELVTYNSEIAERAEKDPEAQLLTTLPGFGPFLALLVKAEVGTFARFSSPSKIASYAGVVSSSRSSGGALRYGRITKQGSGYLRWALVQAATHVRPGWGRLWYFYKRIRSKKGVKIARVALAHKLLIVAWYLVRKREPYQALSLGDSGGVKR